MKIRRQIKLNLQAENQYLKRGEQLIRQKLNGNLKNEFFKESQKNFFQSSNLFNNYS